MMKRGKVGWLLFAMLSLPVAAQQNSCGDLRNGYGPFDYWTEHDKVVVVEQFHFTPEVEMLRAGKSGTIAGDLDYTLRASPNHPRALVAMQRLAEREKVRRLIGATYSVDCYFERAIRFRPKDGMARLIFSSYLSKQGKTSEAIEQLKSAEEAGLESGNFYYNLGLAYTDVKQYDKALVAAHRAYALGFNLPGLKNKLVKAGKWSDAPPAAAALAKPGDAATTDGEAVKSDDSRATKTGDVKSQPD